MAYQMAGNYQVYVSLETQERLGESFFESSQDDARSNSNNFGSANDTIYASNLFYWTVSAGGGNDDIRLGNDTRDFPVYAGSGDDDVEGGAGHDLIYGGSGNDWIFGGGGNDVAYGGSGDDHIDDELEGNDTFYGGSGNDHIEGGYGNDVLWGGVDNDNLYGQAGNDTLNGGFGNDMLNGGRGQDVLTGESGADTFAFGDASSGYNHSPASTPDRIADFSRAEGDRIDLQRADSNLDAAGFQNDFFFSNGPSNTIGAIWIEGSGADRTVYINTSVKAGAEMAIAVHIDDANPALSSYDFLI